MATAEVRQHYSRLATPKSLPAGFLEERRSIYWENSIPDKDYSKTTTFVLAPRQEQLVYSKQLHPEYQGDRPSPIWPVSKAAQSACSSQRMLQLAQPKCLHTQYQPCREVKTVIPRHALQGVPSDRLSTLALHKTFPPLPIKAKSEWDWGEWHSDISQAARTTTASGRVIVLSETKQPHPKFKPSRHVQWEVSRSAQTHVATERVGKLSQPKNKNGELEDYNPRAWSVSHGALAAQASPRITELATPLTRKCRAKKT